LTTTLVLTCPFLHFTKFFGSEINLAHYYLTGLALRASAAGQLGVISMMTLWSKNFDYFLFFSFF